MNVECNDPLKDMKNIYAAIKTMNQVSVDARIKLWWLNELYIKHPEIQERIIGDMFQRLGLAIQEAAKKSKSLVTLEKTKHGEDQLLQLSAIVIKQSELYNYLKITYEEGYKTGFENGQIFSKHLIKEPSMLVMNEPKVCSEKKCGMKFYYIKNQETSRFVPVDLDSLSADEIHKVERFETVYFDKTRHVSHFKTCLNPDRFSKNKKG